MVTLLGNGYLTYNGGGGSGIQTVFDGDAMNFIINVGITDLNTKMALNDLCVDLKYHDIWNQCLAIYPFVGGTASTHKFNLKNPRNTDAAYRLTFSGTWVHSSTGALPNGSTAYATTFVNALSSMTYNNNHLSYYSRTISANSSTETTMGSGDDNTGVKWISLFSRRSSNIGGYDSGNNAPTNRASFTNTNGSGFYLGKANSTTGQLYKNGIQSATKVLTSGLFSNTNITIGAINTIANGLQFFSPKEFSYVSIGYGLTDNQAFQYNQIVQRFQISLARNV